MKEYQDYFFKKAKKEGVRSRAFFKLEEIDKKHRLLSPGNAVLDLGCAPGSWLEYVAKRVGKSGVAVGVDTTKLSGSFPPCVRWVQEDIMTLEPQKLIALAGRPFDVVLSDAASNTTGERFVDQHNSVRLVEGVLRIAVAVLKPGGHLLTKIFQGPDTPALMKNMRSHFESVHSEKPQSSRKESFEVYWVGLRKKA